MCSVIVIVIIIGGKIRGICIDAGEIALLFAAYNHVAQPKWLTKAHSISRPNSSQANVINLSGDRTQEWTFLLAARSYNCCHCPPARDDGNS